MTTTKNWSVQQKAIFTWCANLVGNLVVRARAGTGKTTTIIEAVTHIPATAKKVLVCAFARRNKLDFDAKLQEAGADLSRVEAKTLNALGFKYVMRNRKIARMNGVDDQVEWDRIDAVAPSIPNEMSALVYKLVGFAKNMLPFGTVSEIADLAVERDCCPENGFEASGWTPERIATIARDAMNLALEVPDSQNRVSFNDQLFLPVVLGWVTRDYDVVIVDECQDMNATQLLLARAACKKDGHVIVVGDDRQAIYGFRGADSASIDRLKAELNADELPLSVTYRCPKAVVAIAQTLVDDYTAAPSAPEGTVDVTTVEKLHETVRVNDAILSRTNAPLVPICLGLIRKGVSARIEGKDIGKQLVALVKKLTKQNSIPAFLTRLAGWSEKQKARIVARTKNERTAAARCEGINDQVETLAALAEGCVSVTELTERCIRMFSDTRNPDGSVSKVPAVVCSSVHKAKGLEWERVFILEGTLYCGGKRKDQEEANIHYVAVTRSKNTLVMVREAV